MKIGERVKAIRDNADSSDPVRSPDPIAFISVFVMVLYGLVPEAVVQRRKDEIYEVMGELAGIIVEGDTSSLLRSHKFCLTNACFVFDYLVLVDPNLRPKLTKLLRTCDSEWRY